MGSATVLVLACVIICIESIIYDEETCQSFQDSYREASEVPDTYYSVFLRWPEECLDAWLQRCLSLPEPRTLEEADEQQWSLANFELECKARQHCEKATDTACKAFQEIGPVFALELEATWAQAGEGAKYADRGILQLYRTCPACDAADATGTATVVFFICVAVCVAIFTAVSMGNVGPSAAHGGEDDGDGQDSDEEEKDKIFERRSLSGLKEGKGGPWVISPAGATLCSSMCAVARMATGGLAVAQPSHPNLLIRAVVQKAKLLPVAMLAQPCWGGALYVRESAGGQVGRAKWEAERAWLIPVSTKQVLWWQRDSGLMRLRTDTTWGDKALLWLPQILTVCLGLFSRHWLVIGATIILAVWPIAWHHQRGAAHNNLAAQPAPQSIGNPVSASLGLPGVFGTRALPGQAGMTHWRDQCSRMAKPLLPVAKHSAAIVCLSVVMATNFMDLLLLAMYILGLLKHALGLALLATRLASARLADPDTRRCSMLARLQIRLAWLHERFARTQKVCARLARAMEFYFDVVSVAGSAALLFTTGNSSAGALVALVLLAPLANRVSGHQRKLEIETCDSSSVKESVGERGQKLLEDELCAHGWVQPRGEFMRHIRQRVRQNPELKQYEPALRLICYMKSLIDVLRVARDPRFLGRLAVLNAQQDGSLHVGGLTRCGFQKLHAGVNYEKITFQEKNTTRREVPPGVDTRPTTRDVVDAQVAQVNTPGFAARNVDQHVLQAAVEYVGRFILSDVNPADQPRHHKIQVEVRGRTEVLNQDSVHRLNVSLDLILLESLGRGGRKPRLFVVGNPADGDFDVPDYGPPTPEDIQVSAEAARVIVSL